MSLRKVGRKTVYMSKFDRKKFDKEQEKIKLEKEQEKKELKQGEIETLKQKKSIFKDKGYDEVTK